MHSGIAFLHFDTLPNQIAACEPGRPQTVEPGLFPGDNPIVQMRQQAIENVLDIMLPAGFDVQRGGRLIDARYSP